jgi:hypothetical protein
MRRSTPQQRPSRRVLWHHACSAGSSGTAEQGWSWNASMDPRCWVSSPRIPCRSSPWQDASRGSKRISTRAAASGCRSYASGFDRGSVGRRIVEPGAGLGACSAGHCPRRRSLASWGLHPDNVIRATRGATAIDWMSAARGDRGADAARTALILELGPQPPGLPATRRALIATGRRAFRASWLRAYVRASIARRAEITAWRPVVAAARLGDNILEEKRRLCAIVDAAARADS